MGNYNLYPNGDVINFGVPIPNDGVFYTKIDEVTADGDTTHIRLNSLEENIFTFPTSIVPNNEPITNVRAT